MSTAVDSVQPDLGSDAPAPVPFARRWRETVVRHGGRPFLRFEASNGEVGEWTYDEFDRLVRRICARFVALGVTPERGVHLALTNSPSFVAAWLAAMELGSWIVPSDPMATTPELVEHLSRTAPAVSVASTARAEVAGAAVQELAGSERVERVGRVDQQIALLTVDEDDIACTGLVHVDGVDVEPLDVEALPAPGRHDRAAIMFTSGTTGRPKGVVVTQANYDFAGTAMAAAAGLGPDHRQLVVLPLFHANAQYYSFASAIAVGASVALMHTFSASGFLRQARAHGATHASLFAGPMRMILARAQPDPDHPVALQHCWFAQNLAEDQYETLADWLGCRPRQLYGMTETIPAVLTDDAEDPRPDAMGSVTPGCAVELHDEDGRPVADGEVGEIVVGGVPGLTLFAGYLDDPDTTARSFRDEWFRTGDRARIAADGRFEFDGRRADVLKVAGENVSVVEVEAVIGTHPEVFDVVVVGAPDPIRDEVPVAFVVPTDGDVVDDAARSASLADELDAWCTERLSKSKRPRRFSFVAELPRTSVGKIRKFLLADAASAAAHAEPSAPEEGIR